MKPGSLMLIHSKPRIDTNRPKLDPQYMYTNRLPPKRIEFARTDSQRIDRIDSNRNNFTPPILVYQEYRLPVKRFGFTRFDSQRIDRIDSNRSNFTPPILHTRNIDSLWNDSALRSSIRNESIESNRVAITSHPRYQFATNRLKIVATF